MSTTPAPFTFTPQVLIVDLGETAYTNPVELEPADVQVAALDSTLRPWVFRFYGDPGLDHAIAPDGRTHLTYTHDGSTPVNVPMDLWTAVMLALDPDWANAMAEYTGRHGL